MDRTHKRIDTAKKALSALEEVLRIENPTAIERDAAILRFEFTFEATWKAAKATLYVREGVDPGSPKGVIRASREAGLLDDEQTALALGMVDDRNLSVHTYNETLAVKIHGKLASYCNLMKVWLERMA